MIISLLKIYFAVHTVFSHTFATYTYSNYTAICCSCWNCFPGLSAPLIRVLIEHSRAVFHDLPSGLLCYPSYSTAIISAASKATSATFWLFVKPSSAVLSACSLPWIQQWLGQQTTSISASSLNVFLKADQCIPYILFRGTSLLLLHAELV